MSKCVVCGEPILISIFRNEEYCCDDHRKILTGEKPPLVKETRLIKEARITEISIGMTGFPFTILN